MGFMMRIINYYIEIKVVVGYAIIVVVATYIGYSFSRNYVNKYRIYNQLYDFLNYYKLEVGYSQKRIGQILEEYAKNNKVSILKLEEFLEFLRNDFYDKDKFYFKERIYILEEKEQIEIEEIFNDLGKYDLIQEKEKIEILLNRVKNNLDLAKENKNKYSNLCIKLGLITGCFIVVLLI